MLRAPGKTTHGEHMKTLPSNPSLEHLRSQAKDLLRLVQSADPDALARIRESAPHLVHQPEFRLHDAQFIVAREYGFASWNAMIAEIQAQRVQSLDATGFAFAVTYACLGAGYDDPSLTLAEKLVAQDPDRVATDPALCWLIGENKEIGDLNQKLGPLSAPPLVLACGSILIKSPAYRPALLALIRALLEGGADPNGTYTDPEFPTSPLSALYVAAGRTRDLEVVEILLAAGANPNDGESVYHACESNDLSILRALIDAGARLEGTNALMRKLDFEDLEGLRLLLDSGINPNGDMGRTPSLIHAIIRGRSQAVVELLVQRGANTGATWKGRKVVQFAIERGRDDLLHLFPDAEVRPETELLSLCAKADLEGALAKKSLIASLSSEELGMISEWAALGKVDAVKTMVAIGWPIDALGGDWGSTALNQAVFRGDADLARFLLESGADWRVQHGYGDHVIGTLSFVSRNRVVDQDRLVECFEVLVESGVPAEAFEGYSLSDEVTIALERWRAESVD